MSATPAPRRGLLGRLQPEPEHVPEPAVQPPLPVRGPDPSRPRVSTRWPGRASELRRTQVLAHDDPPSTSAGSEAPPAWPHALVARVAALLSAVVEGAPEGATALLSTADGYPVAAHGLGDEDAVRRAALTASMHALATNLHTDTDTDTDTGDEGGLRAVTVADGRHVTVVRRVPSATLQHPLLVVSADETDPGLLLERARSLCLELAREAD